MIKIGVMKNIGDEEELLSWYPTADYLSEQIDGYLFRIYPVNRYNLKEAIENKKIDFLLTDPGWYVEYESTGKLTAIAMRENYWDGEFFPQMGAVIITRSNRNDLNKIEDLDGKIITTSSENSYEYWISLKEIEEHGIDVNKDIKEVRFKQSMEKVIETVESGDTDAGIITTGILEYKYQNQKENFTKLKVINSIKNENIPVVHSTELYPEWVFAKAKDTPSELSEQVVIALFNKPLENSSGMRIQHGWTNPSNNQKVRQLLMELKAGPYKDYGKITIEDLITQYGYAIELTILLLWILASGLYIIKNKNSALEREIHNRKLAERSLNEKNEEIKKIQMNLEMILNSLPIGVMVIDASNDTIVDANPVALDQIEITEKEIIGQKHSSFIHINRTSSDFEGEKDMEEHILVTSKGRHIPILRSFKDVVQNGETYHIESFIDIEKRKAVEEALLAAKKAAEDSNRTKSEFLANMSHELRTPLNAIIGFSQVLSSNRFRNMNDKQVKYSTNILKSGKHLLSLINNILDISKVESGNMEVQCDRFNIVSTITEILELVTPLSKKKNITLKTHFQTDELELNCDHAKIKGVLYNLFSNAIKFTYENGNVNIYCKTKDDRVQISVSDDGIGIPEEKHRSIFEPFKQVDSSHSRQYQGTGLGLALVKQYIELHGGTIWVESKAGKGSVFTFEIPMEAKECTGKK